MSAIFATIPKEATDIRLLIHPLGSAYGFAPPRDHDFQVRVSCRGQVHDFSFRKEAHRTQYLAALSFEAGAQLILEEKAHRLSPYS